MTGKRLKALLWIMASTLLFQGCASKYSIVEFEILEPATIEFPDHVKQLLVLNRAPVSLDIWAEQNQAGMDWRQLVLLDTLIINNLFRGVLQVLRNSPVDKFHTPIWLSDRRTDTALLEDRILTRREVDNICDTIAGDAIISLEYYSAGMDQHFDYYSDAPDEIRNQYVEVWNRVNWKIYLPGRPRPFDTYETVDTLFFPAIAEGEFLPFVPVVEMFRTLFQESGHKYGSYLVPVWNPATRKLYRGRNDSLKQAVKFTDAGDWDSAFSIWNQLTGSEDSTLAARAYHNLAVYYELEDNLDSASIMIDLSLRYHALEADSLYREELDVRILNRQDILKQVN